MLVDLLARKDDEGRANLTPEAWMLAALARIG